MTGAWRAQLPAEVVAVITAAISAAMDQPVGSFAIRSIEPAAPGWGSAPSGQGPVGACGVAPGPGPVGAGAWAGSGWAKAGVMQAHLTRAQFGGRSR